ncbi:uncharacterized protein DDB_G0283697-like [Papaver somniferum]|uniref:uncharacterized protein DDB_G0283697-like n=1 Tax=Papaver somniferum TaxID=3469 RepID=UPI000E6FD278|nr:uncharacterized protein DDB_G0283697-like [Papaver somniferum]
MDEIPTKTRLQKSKEKKSGIKTSLIDVTADDEPEADEKGESDSEQPLKEMKMKAKHDDVKRKEVSVLTSFLPANDDNLSDGKGETDGDQQQKETRTNVKHDAAKKKKKVSDPETTTPSRKSQRLKDQVSPSSPKPEAEKKTKTKKKADFDRQAEEQLIVNTSASRVQADKATKRKKKAEKAAPKEVLDDDTKNEDDTDDTQRKMHQRKLCDWFASMLIWSVSVKQAVDKQKKRKGCEPKQSEDLKRKKKEKQIERSESEEEDEEEELVQQCVIYKPVKPKTKPATQGGTYREGFLRVSTLFTKIKEKGGFTPMQASMMNASPFGKFYNWLSTADMSLLDGKSSQLMDEVLLSYNHDDLSQH